MASKKPSARRVLRSQRTSTSPSTKRIVGLHNSNRRKTLDTVRFENERLAGDAGTQMESKERGRLRKHLESAIGVSIAPKPH
jgi:hypothetical protein